MQPLDTTKLLRIVVVAMTSAIIGIPAFVSAVTQTNPTPSGAGSIQLQPYTTQDQSAAAGVPAGWKVTDGEQSFIQMAGPQGESIYLGVAFIAKSGAFQMKQKGPAGANLIMPSTAKLTDKLTMILQNDAALAGKPVPQIAFVSATPLQMPPVLGQCGRFVISITGVATPAKAMGAICSLPVDSAGFFKNIMLLATAPAATAAQDAPIVQAVFASYKVPQNWLERKLAPFTAPPAPASAPAAQGGTASQTAAILAATRRAQAASDLQAKCFDLTVLRETPDRLLPPDCR